MMNRIGRACIYAVMVCLTVACYRQEIVTVEIDVPQMGSPECRRLLLQSLSKLEQDALIRVDLDTDKRLATITYDTTRLGLKNIEFAITSAGFDANDEKATESARAALPVDCR